MLLSQKCKVLQKGVIVYILLAIYKHFKASTSQGTKKIQLIYIQIASRLRKVSPSGMVKCREFERALAVQLIMLAPLAPHFASELWAGFCSAPGRIVNDGEIRWDKEVLEQNWPQIDMDFKLKLNVFVSTKLCICCLTNILFIDWLILFYKLSCF